MLLAVRRALVQRDKKKGSYTVSGVAFSKDRVSSGRSGRNGAENGGSAQFLKLTLVVDAGQYSPR